MEDSVVILALSPHSSPIPFVTIVLLLSSSPQVEVVELGDGGISESESIESDETKKNTTKTKKGPKSSKLISQVPKNPFSSTIKTLTPIKINFFSIDTLRITSKVFGT